jgi:hypothetical protein
MDPFQARLMFARLSGLPRLVPEVRKKGTCKPGGGVAGYIIDDSPECIFISIEIFETHISDPENL